MAMLFFYVRFILKLTLVAGQYYVLKGSQATLTPSLAKDPDDILWRHNGNKVITFDTAEELVFGSYEGRVTLAWNTAELTIADVRYEDSGEYELDVFIRDRPHHSQYMLKVLDKVSVPVIRCEMNDESGDSNNRSATLFCSSESETPEALTFKWNVDGKSHLGQTLPIALGNEQDDVTYSCTANNPLQEENGSFMAKDCYTERTAQPRSTLVLSIIIPIIIVLAFAILGFVLYKLKRGNNDDIEKQPNAAGQKRAKAVKNKDECDPLLELDLHRQKTMPSQQRLPTQEHVDETPQGKVKDLRRRFENFGTTETPQGEPASPSRREPKPTPFPEQRVSEDERNLPNQELNNVSNSEEAGDADSNHSELDEFKDAQEEQSPSIETEVNQDLEPTPEEQELNGTTDSEMKSDEHRKDHEDDNDDDDEQEKDAADPSSSRQSDLDESTEVLQPPHRQSSDENVQPTNKEQAGLTEQANPDHNVDKEQQKDSTVEPVLTPHTTASEQTELLQSPQSGAAPLHAVEHERKEQTNPEEESNNESEEYKVSQEEQSPSSETEVNQDLEPTPEEQESSGTTDSEMKSNEHRKDHEDDEQEKDAADPLSSIQSGPDESTKAPEQPEPQSPESEPEESSGTTGSGMKSNERHKDHEDDELEKDAAGLSSSIQSALDETTNAPEQPGSGEQASESTLPPASSLSQRADNKQTKGTDGELTEEDNPLHDGNERRD